MLKDLPVISYGGVFGVSDITQPQIKISAATVDYKQKTPMRMDVIADKYYGNDRFDRYVADANDVVNPFDFVIADQKTIDDEAVRLYGSIEKAKQFVVYWKNNWEDDDSILTKTVYDALPPSIHQLYDQVKDYSGKVSGYSRKKIDSRKSTNIIVKYVVKNTSLVANKHVTITNGTQEVIGRGHIISVSGDFVIVHDIIGLHDDLSVTKLDGQTITSAIVLSKPIADEEVRYFSPVTGYDLLTFNMTTGRENIVVYNPADIQALQ